MWNVIISISNPIIYSILHAVTTSQTHIFCSSETLSYFTQTNIIRQLMHKTHSIQYAMCKEPATPLLLLFSLIKYLSLGTHQNIFCLLAYFASELHTAHTQQNMSVNLTDSFSDSIVFIISIPPMYVCRRHRTFMLQQL